MGLGIYPDSRRRHMYDVFMSVFEGFPDVPITEVITKTESGIDLAPSNLDLVGVEPSLYMIDDRSGILRDLLEPVRHAYDYILIDTPPSMGQFVINGLVAADHIVVTIDAGIFALRGIDGLETIFEDIGEIVGRRVTADLAILTRWEVPGTLPAPTPEPAPRGGLSGLFARLFGRSDPAAGPAASASPDSAAEIERLTRIEAEVRRRFGRIETVPFSREVYEAQQRGLPIAQFAPDSPAGIAYRRITEGVLVW
jgi:chromosome partitioning protein